MFKPSEAKSIAGYLAAVPDDRKGIVQYLHEFIQVAAPALTPHFASNMLGYGSFTYLNNKKEPLPWPVIALANQKNYVSVYICSIVDGQYLPEKFAIELGKVSVGKSCIRIKKLEDVDLPTLKKVIKLATEHPGLASTTDIS